MADNDVLPAQEGHLPRLLTIKEVADILRIHARTAYRLVKDGALSAIRVGTQWRVTEDALHEYVSRGWKHWRPEPSRPGPRQHRLPIYPPQDSKELP